MLYLEAINEYTGHLGGKTALFAAGGISNCPDWQKDLRTMLDNKNVSDDVIFINPRRYNYIDSEHEAHIQIEWEEKYLMQSDIISFWFPKETLCPITLFELGKMAMTRKRIIVGCHPEYKRKLDVKKQLSLIDDSYKVVESLEELSEQIVAAIEFEKMWPNFLERLFK